MKPRLWFFLFLFFGLVARSEAKEISTVRELYLSDKAQSDLTLEVQNLRDRQSAVIDRFKQRIQDIEEKYPLVVRANPKEFERLKESQKFLELSHEQLKKGDLNAAFSEQAEFFSEMSDLFMKKINFMKDEEEKDAMLVGTFLRKEGVRVQFPKEKMSSVGRKPFYESEVADKEQSVITHAFKEIESKMVESDTYLEAMEQKSQMQFKQKPDTVEKMKTASAPSQSAGSTALTAEAVSNDLDPFSSASTQESDTGESKGSSGSGLSEGNAELKASAGTGIGENKGSGDDGLSDGKAASRAGAGAGAGAGGGQSAGSSGSGLSQGSTASSAGAGAGAGVDAETSGSGLSDGSDAINAGAGESAGSSGSGLSQGSIASSGAGAGAGSGSGGSGLSDGGIASSVGVGAGAGAGDGQSAGSSGSGLSDGSAVSSVGAGAGVDAGTSGSGLSDGSVAMNAGAGAGAGAGSGAGESKVNSGGGFSDGSIASSGAGAGAGAGSGSGGSGLSDGGIASSVGAGAGAGAGDGQSAGSSGSGLSDGSAVSSVGAGAGAGVDAGESVGSGGSGLASSSASTQESGAGENKGSGGSGLSDGSAASSIGAGAGAGAGESAGSGGSGLAPSSSAFTQESGAGESKGSGDSGLSDGSAVSSAGAGAGTGAGPSSEGSGPSGPTVEDAGEGKFLADSNTNADTSGPRPQIQAVIEKKPKPQKEESLQNEPIAALIQDWILQEKLLIQELKKFKPVRQQSRSNPPWEYYVLKQKQMVTRLKQLRRRIEFYGTKDEYWIELNKLSKMANRLLDILNSGQYTEYEVSGTSYDDFLEEIESIKPEKTEPNAQVSPSKADDENIPPEYRSAVSRYFKSLSES